MLALPIWIMWGPKAALPVLPARGERAVLTAAASVNLPAPGGTIATPWDASDPASKPPVWNWAGVWIGAYLLGAGALLLRLAIGTIRANRLTGASCAAPVTVGLLRPRVILPECWSTWPPAQLDAVLTHERAHARRRDPLVQWLALLNRALFWFHPLAWWLERRLTALAEEACDAAVLEHGHDPRDYSEYLLDLARVVQRAGMRVNMTGMAMPGSYLPQRIRKIIAGVSASRISPARMACAAVACAICSAMFAAGTLEHVAKVHLPRTPPVQVPSPGVAPARVLLARATAAPQAAAQSAPAAMPKFEVASIKACKDEAAAGGTGRKGGGQGGSGSSSPDRLDLPCLPVRFFIQLAYIITNNRLGGWRVPVLEGGPAWIASDRYRIDAKAEGPAGKDMMNGPMLQALLEDRFQLKIHRATREVPFYALTVAKGGLKLQLWDGGSCLPADPSKPLPPPVPGQKSPCGLLRKKTASHGIAIDLLGASMEQFSNSLGDSGRPVIDRTGIKGKFDFHLVFAPDGADPSDDLAAASIFSALGQLGLKLEPVKGPREFLVIDRVERPLEN